MIPMPHWGDLRDHAYHSYTWRNPLNAQRQNFLDFIGTTEIYSIPHDVWVDHEKEKIVVQYGKGLTRRMIYAMMDTSVEKSPRQVIAEAMVRLIL